MLPCSEGNNKKLLVSQKKGPCPKERSGMEEEDTSKGTSETPLSEGEKDVVSVGQTVNTETQQMRHVLILVHGNNGLGIDWDFVQSRLFAVTKDFLVVCSPSPSPFPLNCSNRELQMVSHENEKRTNAGVATGAGRLAEEVGSHQIWRAPAEH